MNGQPHLALTRRIEVAYRIVFWTLMVALGVVLLASPSWSANRVSGAAYLPVAGHADVAILVADEGRGRGQSSPGGTGPGSGKGTTGGPGQGPPGGTGPGSNTGSTGHTGSGGTSGSLGGGTGSGSGSQGGQSGGSAGGGSGSGAAAADSISFATDLLYS